MIKAGDMELTPLSDGTMKLDGGAMFGVVPKALWSRVSPPDEQNRVLLAITPLLIKTPDELILVDPGVVGKGDARFREIYSIERPPTVEGSLKELGYSTGDVTMVINTHLHFDHAGGNTAVGEDGLARPAFENARYLIQKGEVDAARAPNERTRASYRTKDYGPLLDAGVAELVEGDVDAAPGVRLLRTPGHNRDFQLVRVDSGGVTAIFLGDMVPTEAHLRYPYIAGYDLYPLETLEAKKALLARAAEQGWLLFFYHDPALRCARIGMEETASGARAEVTERLA